MHGVLIRHQPEIHTFKRKASHPLIGRGLWQLNGQPSGGDHWFVSLGRDTSADSCDLGDHRVIDRFAEITLSLRWHVPRVLRRGVIILGGIAEDNGVVVYMVVGLEVELGDCPDEPGEVLTQLDGFLLAHKAVE